MPLVVTETFDAGLFGEHVLPTLKHAWEHLLLPNRDMSGEEVKLAGKVIPSKAQVRVAIVECDYIARQTKAIIKSELLQNINVKLQLNEPYLSEKISNVPGKYKLITEWKNILEVDFNSLKNINELLKGKKEDIEFLITAEGRGDAIVLSYSLILDTDNIIDTCPETGTCWENAIYPIFSSKLYSKESYVKVELEFNEVIYLKVIDFDEEFYVTTSDVQLLKCLNSISYLKFYCEVAERLLEINSSDPLIVLDNCPFPEGGLRLMERNPNTKLFIDCPSAFELLSPLQINLKSSKHLKGQVDVIFFWPFAPEGTLKENLCQQLSLVR